MSISNDTLQAMIQAYGGFELTDDEVALVRPELENYVKEVEKLRELDLSSVMSSRLIQAQQGGQARPPVDAGLAGRRALGRRRRHQH